MVTLNLITTSNFIVKLYRTILRLIIYTLIPFLLLSLVLNFTVKVFMNLSKLYNNEIKFSDEIYNILNTKLKIFYKIYPNS
jgi:hypothetical protein